ncbi:MAG: hypothetical protein ACREMZ_01915 [Gemmatimonadales bacterium]
MTHTFKLARRAARFRAPFFATSLALFFGGCDTADLTDPTASTDPVTAPEELSLPETPSFASGFRGGIPIGVTAQPTSAFGGTFNGALRNIWPNALVKELAAIKARGGKVVLMFAGNERHYKNGRGHFDLGKWKARVNRFKSVNFDSYIKDGTIVGHYLIDEPNDPKNWHGQPIPPATVEEMAKYSKQLWAGMATIVRTEPSYLAKWSGKYRYLNAAWAQYVARKGEVNAFLRRNVSDAQRQGLGLVVGLNISKGSPTKSQMSASQIKTWGSALLSSSYPCAFISWKYEARYLSRSDIKSAMAHLAGKARSRPTKACGSGAKLSAPPPNSPPASPPPPNPRAERRKSSISLKAIGWSSARRQHMRVTWSGASGSSVDLYRNGVRIMRTPNDGHNINGRAFRGKATYVFKVCEKGSSNCSNSVRVVFR